tara:strand:- start:72 stop:884 length:813 start_codon:yes stop_codon:yes gene_type:complete
MCGIAYWSARFVDPVATDKQSKSFVEFAKNLGEKLGTSKEILEPYGLAKLVPILSLILVVATLYILNGPVTSGLNKIPPYVYYMPDQLVAKYTSENDARLLVRKYAPVKSFREVYHKAIGAHYKDTADFQVITGNREVCFKITIFLKFSLVVGSLVFFASVKREYRNWTPWTKFARLLVSIGFLWIITGIASLYYTEVHYRDTWVPILELVRNDANVLPEPVDAMEEDMIIKTKEKSEWWRVEFFGTDWIDWLDETFLADRLGFSKSGSL